MPVRIRNKVSVAIQMNKEEYGENYPLLRWVTEEEAQRAAKEREEILESLQGKVQFGFRETKLDCTKLSPGCLLCGEGAWSCLFINSICNAHCFFCPTEQPSKSEPLTNGIRFPSPDDYVDYVRRFNIRGVSISGGEPLLTLDRTLLFIRKIKKAFGEKIHLWLYTNGILVNQDDLKRFRDTGVDEMRFNINATHYDLEKVTLAVPVIDTVTVEIPAVPEKYDLLKGLLRPLHNAGVKFLNLHQLRCTPHNAQNIIKRDYTLLHGPQPTVLQSELTALRLLMHAKENHIGLPINYCSFVYKNSAQTVAYRKRLAAFLRKPFEDITEAGAIRRMSIKGQPDTILAAAEKLKNTNGPEAPWQLTSNKDRIFFNESVWGYLDFSRYALFVDYYVPLLMPTVSYQNSYEEIRLNSRKKVIIERKHVLRDRELTGDAVRAFQERFIGPHENGAPAREADGNQAGFTEITEMEGLRSGLQEYY